MTGLHGNDIFKHFFKGFILLTGMMLAKNLNETAQNYGKGFKRQSAHDPYLSQSFQLLENFLNPFNPKTILQFVLPEAQQIELQIFDSGGRLVRQLARGDYSAGLHQLVWDGRNDAQKALPSGVYFYRLSANGKQLTKKMILMK